MAFLTTSNIANQLPVGFDTLQVDRFLLVIEGELRRIGLIFTDESSSTFVIKGDHIPTRIFNITPTRHITAIVIANPPSFNTSTLVLGQDYRTDDHVNIAGCTTHIELLNRALRGHGELRITGNRGIFVNFADSASYDANLLRASIVDWIRSELNIKKGQSVTERGITQATTGDSTVRYASASGGTSSRSFIDSPDTQQTLNWFLGV